MEAIKHKKAQMLYDVIDSSRLFTCAVEPGSRSDMNVVFRTGSDELDAKFVQESVAAGFTNLKGHRSVGGMRASIYNAMPTEGVEKLCDFIKAFDRAIEPAARPRNQAFCRRQNLSLGQFSCPKRDGNRVPAKRLRLLRDVRTRRGRCPHRPARRREKCPRKYPCASAWAAGR